MEDTGKKLIRLDEKIKDQKKQIESLTKERDVSQTWGNALQINYEKLKAENARYKDITLEDYKKEFAGDMGWDHDILKEQIESLTKERDDLEKKIRTEFALELDAVKKERDDIRDEFEIRGQLLDKVRGQRDKYKAANGVLRQQCLNAGTERYLEVVEPLEKENAELKKKVAELDKTIDLVMEHDSNLIPYIENKAGIK